MIVPGGLQTDKGVRTKMSEHISVTKIQEFIGNIVAETVPDEVDSYNLTGARIIQEVLNGQDPRTNENNQFNNEFGGEVGDWLAFIQIIIATVSLLVQLQASGQERSDGDVMDRWKKKLKNAGLRDDMAETISRKFGHEMAVTTWLVIETKTDE